jgi:hypothetical protein
MLERMKTSAKSLRAARHAFTKKNGVRKPIQYGFGITLNSMAYKTMLNWREDIAEDLTVRNKTIVKSMTGYTRAKFNLPINSQKAYVRTKTKRRFTGWIEQPTAGVDKRKRKWTDEARIGKSNKRQVRGKYRFKPGKSIPEISRAGGGISMPEGKEGPYGGQGGAFPFFMNQLKAAGYYDQPFMSTGMDEVKDGVYVLTRSGTLKFIAARNEDRIVDRKADMFTRGAKKAFTRPHVQREFNWQMRAQMARFNPPRGVKKGRIL